jgi:hypothetical protein
LGFNRLNPESLLVGENFDTVSITQTFAEPFTLIFYYSNYACSPCLERELNWLRLENDSIPDANIYIIGATSSMRSLAAVIRTYRFHCRLFQFVGMDGIIEGHPFLKESMFLVINKEGTIHSVLVPPKNDDETIKLFFRSINTRYLNARFSN